MVAHVPHGSTQSVERDGKSLNRLTLDLADMRILACLVRGYGLAMDAWAEGGHWLQSLAIFDSIASHTVPDRHWADCALRASRIVFERFRQERRREGVRAKEEKMLKPRCRMRSALAQPSGLLGPGWDRLRIQD